MTRNLVEHVGNSQSIGCCRVGVQHVVENLIRELGGRWVVFQQQVLSGNTSNCGRTNFATESPAFLADEVLCPSNHITGVVIARWSDVQTSPSLHVLRTKVVRSNGTWRLELFVTKENRRNIIATLERKTKVNVTLERSAKITRSRLQLALFHGRWLDPWHITKQGYTHTSARARAYTQFDSKEVFSGNFELF